MRFLNGFFILCILLGGWKTFSQEGKGEIETELSYFDEAEISACDCTIELLPAEKNIVVVRSPRMLAEKIRPQILNDKLTLLYNSLVRSTDQITVTIHYTNLKSLKIGGPSKLITAEPIRGENFNLALGGGSEGAIEVINKELKVLLSNKSELKVSGEVEKQVIELRDKSVYSAFDLKSEKAIIQAENGCRAEVFAAESVEGVAKYGASILYKGNPEKIDIATKYGGSASKVR